MTHRYRAKPVEIEAARFTAEGDNGDRVEAWIREQGGEVAHHLPGVADPKCPTPEYHETHHYCPSCPWNDDTEHIVIATLEGNMRASVGDYIIRGTAGEFYPVKPEIFEAKYDRLD